MSQFAYNVSLPDPVLSVSSPSKEGENSNITFYTQGNEMLKVTSDGFYVRGKKIPVDDKEAESVYRAFRQFLVWAALTKD